MAKNGIGRPTRGADLSIRVVGIRFTAEEVEIVKTAAGFEPLSSWLRRMALAAAAAHEAGSAGEAADGARTGRAPADRKVERVSTRKTADARGHRRTPARAGAGGRTLRRKATQGA